MYKEKRTIMFHLRMSREEHQKLARLSRLWRIPASRILREAVEWLYQKHVVERGVEVEDDGERERG